MCSRSAQSEEQQADMVDNKVDNMVDIKEKETKKKVFFCFERALDPLNLRSSRLRKSLRQNKSGGGGGKVFRSKSRQYKSSLSFHVFVSITERSHHEKISVVDKQ